MRVYAGNLLSYADASVESGVGNWADQTGSTLTSDATRSYDSTHSLKYTSVASGTTLINFGITTINIPVTVGVTYTLSCYMFPVTTAFTGGLDIDWRNGNTFLSATQNLSITTTANVWNLLSITGTAPASSTNAQIFAGFNKTAGSQVSNYDAFFFGVPLLLPGPLVTRQAMNRAASW